MNHVSGPVYLDFCAHRSRIGGRWAGSFYIYRAFSSNVHPALYFAAFQLRLRSIRRSRIGSPMRSDSPVSANRRS
jgi:hypothetical protein